ncbi:MAG: permease prefix domain 1-containing protein, partial [Clostridia bacterium]|nr:permease prefix domain 1-containing protein [Clostridia bacterium]
MQNKDFINEILNKIKCKDAHNDISNELNSHIADLKEKYIEEGNTPELAEKKSIEQMGDSTIIADGFNKIYKYNFDWVLLTIVSLLFLCGIIVGNMLISNNFTININIISICLSTIIGVALILCNYKKLQNYSKILFFITFVITILAKFVPIISNFYLIILALYLISFSGNIVNTKLNLKTTAMIILSLLVTAFSLGKINFFLLAISFIILYISQNKLIINKYTISIFCIICAISLMLIIHN